jgi:hypothetical protein
MGLRHQGDTQFGGAELGQEFGASKGIGRHGQSMDGHVIGSVNVIINLINEPGTTKNDSQFISAFAG